VVVVAALAIVLFGCGPRTAGSPSPAPSPSPSPSYAPLQIESTTLKAAEVGLDYGKVSLQAFGGLPPYSYMVGPGAVPGGMTLSTDGVLSGMPTAAGDFTFTVQVTDSRGVTAGAEDSIDVVSALTLAASHSGTIYVESGCDSTCGGFATESGGQAPFTYALSSGSLPPGTSLSGPTLAGKFGSAGTFRFTVQVTDALGATAAVTPTFSVIQHIHFYCPSPWPGGPGGCNPAGYNGALTFLCGQAGDHPDCSGQMMFAGGSSGGWAVTYKVAAGDQPPAGSYLSVPVNGTVPPQTVISVTLMQPPTPGATAGGTLLVTLSDGMVCGSGGARCSNTAYLTWGVQHRTAY
jgi:large repetitive protein